MAGQSDGALLALRAQSQHATPPTALTPVLRDSPILLGLVAIVRARHAALAVRVRERGQISALDLLGRARAPRRRAVSYDEALC